MGWLILPRRQKLQMGDTIGERLATLERQVLWIRVALWILVVIALLFGARELTGQELATPSQALDWALVDQITISESDRPWQRYLWIPPWATNDSWNAAASYSLNTAASHASVIVRPRVIANGWMIAVDLRILAPTIGQLTKLVEVWDSIAITEPYFHVFQESDEGGVSVLAPHVSQDHAEMLAELNVSPALVYRLDWFLSRMLDDRYYDFMQFPSTLTEVLATVGASETLSKQIGGDQRVAIFNSLVSAKPRRIDRIQGAAGRFNTGSVWITRDIFDETATIAAHPIYNLLEFNEDGGEVIFERSNGMHAYVLVNASGGIVREAPPNLVSDHTIPAPHTRQLRPAISCIRCHGPAEGLQPVTNDVRTLVTSGAIDVFDDFGNLNVSRQENIDRLAGLYAGDFTRRILLGRDDLTVAVRLATRMATKPEGLSIPEVSSLVSSIYGDYVYNLVDAETACRELGYDPGDNPLATIQRVLPKLPPDPQIGLQFEDPTAAALRVGINVRRTDFERIYATARLLIREQEIKDAQDN